MNLRNLFLLSCFFLNCCSSPSNSKKEQSANHAQNKEVDSLSKSKSSGEVASAEIKENESAATKVDLGAEKELSSLAGRVYSTGSGLDNNCQRLPGGTDLFQIILFVNDSQFVRKVYSCCHFNGEAPNEKINKGIYSIKNKRLVLNFEPQTYAMYNQKLKGKTYYENLVVEKTDISTVKFEILYCKGAPYFKEIEGPFKDELIIEDSAENESLSKFGVFQYHGGL